VLAPAPSHNARQLLVVPSLSNAGLLDLANNDMIVQGAGPAGLATTTAELKKGYNSGNWNGTSGITSSAAASDTSQLTALGVIQNDDGSGTALYSTFDGTAVTDADVLVKFTYYGDTNLDGTVDGSDYSRLDNAFLNNQNSSNAQLTGWFNGDFNYDGIIDGSDYTLIDNVFNTQGAQLDTNIASAIETAQISGSGTAVPEPVGFSTLGLFALGLLGRRRQASAGIAR
jgi:hypothetical protein